MNKKQKIRMVAFNPQTKEYEEVFPESEVQPQEMIPQFWSEEYQMWMTVPGTRAGDVLDEWLMQE